MINRANELEEAVYKARMRAGGLIVVGKEYYAGLKIALSGRMIPDAKMAVDFFCGMRLMVSADPKLYNSFKLYREVDQRW